MSKGLYAKIALPLTAVILVLAVVALAQPNPREVQTKSPTSARTRDRGDGGDSPGSLGGARSSPAPQVSNEQATSKPSQSPKDFPRSTDAERADGPPTEGHYLYHVKTGFEGSDAKERDQTFEVRNAAPTAGEEARQFVEFLGGRAEVSWRNDGLYLLAVDGAAFRCDFEPDVLSLKFPLTAGSTWSSESSCDFEANGQKGKVTRVENVTVVGTEIVAVDGVKVQTFVIKRTGKSTVTFGVQSYAEESEGTENFSRKYGLMIKSSSKSTSTSPDGRKFNAFAELQLLKLNPAK